MARLPGVDLSYAQPTTLGIAPYAFVFVRAGYGSGHIDSKWSAHSARVRAAGKVLGAYWFWYLAQDNAAAVAAFLNAAANVDLLALDLEGASANTSEGHAEAADFIARVHAAGNRIGLYHSDSGFPSLGQDWNWVAKWAATAPTRMWAFWQFTDHLGGANLDGDWFNGDGPALEALIHPLVAATAVVEAEMKVIRVKGEDFLAGPAGGRILSAPACGGSALIDLAPGTIIRSIAQVSGTDGSDLRLTEYAGQPGYLCYRKADGTNGPWQPAVAGGDAAVDGELIAYIGRKVQTLLTSDPGAATGGGHPLKT